MARKDAKGKQVANGKMPADEIPSEPLPAPAAPSPSSSLERVKVNNANLGELKHALDDAVKEYFGRTYRRSYRHENVRLALGWTGVVLAGGISLYGLKVPFKDHKTLLFIVVLTYSILSAALALYVKYVERDCIFIGKRKEHASRIETHRLVLTSRLSPKPYNDPKYKLELDYLHSTNNGKSLLANRTAREHIPIRTVFDVNGLLSRPALEARLVNLESASSS